MTTMSLVANAAGAISQGMACVNGDHAACMFAMGQVVAGTRAFTVAPVDNAPTTKKEPPISPTREYRAYKCYGAGQFIPGGGRAPAGGLCM